jgi:hypothetical protein
MLALTGGAPRATATHAGVPSGFKETRQRSAQAFPLDFRASED